MKQKKFPPPAAHLSHDTYARTVVYIGIHVNKEKCKTHRVKEGGIQNVAATTKSFSLSVRPRRSQPFSGDIRLFVKTQFPFP